MKKFYSMLVFVLCATQIGHAQLVLTQAINEPSVGDIYTRQNFDSTIALSRAGGTGQNWDFSTLVTNMNIETSTYTPVSSSPSPAIFPAATITENQGSGGFQHYKSSLNLFEVQGIQFTGSIINFSNTGTWMPWPLNFGTNVSDQFGGSTTTGTLTASIIGSITINGTGTGTLMLPGGITLNNCLQVLHTLTFTMTSGSTSQAQVQQEYNYYHSSSKFPVLKVVYRTQTTGANTSKSFDAMINKNFVVGLNTQEIKNSIVVFPNPANDLINISLANNSKENVYASLSNILGQELKSVFLGNESLIGATLNVNDLSKGIYLLNLTVGNSSSVKKIVIE